MVLDTCHGYDYAENLYSYLRSEQQRRGVAEADMVFPLIITSGNQDSVAYGGASYEISPEGPIVNSLFLASICEIFLENPGQLRGAYVIQVELVPYGMRRTFQGYSGIGYRQDLAVFFLLMNM